MLLRHVLINCSRFNRSVSGVSLPVPPSLMLESSSAVDRGDSETAAEIVESYPGGGLHGAVADVAMIANAQELASCQVKIRTKR